MPLNPKDAMESAREIAVESTRKAAEIVEHSAEVLKGNVSEGIGGIIKSATDIATTATAKGKEILTGKDDDEDAAAN
jgi:hypothetical protein